jgi:3-mercaptopropionate dioxygenase
MVLTEPMLDFVARVEKLIETTDEVPAVAAGVAAELAVLLRADEILEERHRVPDPEKYRQHIVYVDPAGRFSVVALVWLPGQETPIHDHLYWCVVGLVEGQEEEIRYEFDTAGDILIESQTTWSRPGDVCWLVPPGDDLHKVRNSCPVLAISLHVYGANIAELGSSVNRVYHQPVRQPVAS